MLTNGVGWVWSGGMKTWALVVVVAEPLRVMFGAADAVLLEQLVMITFDVWFR